MRKGRKWFMLAAAAVSLSLVAAACGGDDGDETGPTGGGETAPTGATALEGTITISGSSTVQPITSLVAELFNEDVSDSVAISVDGPGTSDGFILFCDGEIDIQDASRAIEQEEIDACAANGVEYVELAVAFDGITVMTNPANGDVTCLANGDLYGLFGPESTGIDTWAGADDLATAVGGNGGLPDVPLAITAPGEESGTYDAFIDLAGIEDFALEQGVPEDEAASLRTDYQPSPDDNIIITAMEGSDTPLGFVGYRLRRRRRRPGEAARDRRRRWLRGPEPRHDRRRLVPVVPNPVHLREHGNGGGEPGAAGVRRLLHVRDGPRRGRHRCWVRGTARRPAQRVTGCLGRGLGIGASSGRAA